jgi:uncharacterized protein YbaR (Trm112 family)
MTITRPDGFNHEKRDCTVRAFSLATNIEYSIVHETFKIFGRKDKHGVYLKKLMPKICKDLGIEFKMVKRSGTVRKLIAKYPQGNFVCTVAHHAFPIIEGVPHDLKSLNQRILQAWWVRPIEVR